MASLPLEAYRFALDNTADAVLITDPSSVIQYVNPAFTRLTGFAEEDAIGRKPNMQRSRHTTYEFYRHIWSVIRAQGWWRGEVVNVKKSGEEWHSQLTIAQIRDERGERVGYVGVARDITETRRLQSRLREANLEAIMMLSLACEAKDEDTAQHVRRVQQYSYAIALRLGLSQEQAEEIGYSSIMHDVGKLHVPDAILRKPGPLTQLEWVRMRRHPSDGVAILRDKEFYTVARQIAENHHEKWDGGGYPNGRRGEQIPLPGRIVTVADVFDALSSWRPYKEPWTAEDAVRELESQRGKAFDPQVVDAFLALYREGAVANIRREYP